MIKLLKIEVNKILTYKVFWILALLYFAFLALGILMSEFTINNWINQANKQLPIPLPHITLYLFPDIWQNMLFYASIRYFLIFPAIIIIILITNEFTFKTVRQNIVNGMSKSEFLLSKLLVIVTLSLVITVILAAVIFFLGIYNTDKPGLHMILEKLIFVPAFFVQILSFLVFAFFFGFVFRTTGLAIGLFTLYTLIIEPVVYYVLKIPYLQPNNVSPFLPVNSVLKVIEFPNVSSALKILGFHIQTEVSALDTAVPLIYSALMIGIVFWMMKKKDL
jgi:ABC-2 type transport system permease protein